MTSIGVQQKRGGEPKIKPAMIRLAAAATLAVLGNNLSGCQGAGMIIGAGLQGMAGAGKEQSAPTTAVHTTHTCYAATSMTDGMNRICYYDCATGRAAMTVSAATLCPSTMQQ